MKNIVTDLHRPILGIPFAAPLSGKDTTEKNLNKERPRIATMHMSSLLGVVIQNNAEYQALYANGSLLPPEEAIKAFRLGFLKLVRDVPQNDCPHIFVNGACREEFETKQEISIVRRVTGTLYQLIGFRFFLDEQHILARAQKRVQERLNEKKEPRPDDLGNTPIYRYNTFQKNLEPSLEIFSKKGGIIVPIDANGTPDQVLDQITAIYDTVKRPVIA